MKLKMKMKNLLMALFTCVVLIFIYNNRAHGDIYNGFVGPQLIYVCSLGENLSSQGNVYSIGTVTCYTNGVPNYDKTIIFKNKVTKLHMVCADPAKIDMNDTTVWIAVNFQDPSSGSELWEISPGQEWTIKKTYGPNNSIGGISLSTDGRVGWVAVNSISDAPQVERWQLADSSYLPIPVNIKDKEGKGAQTGNIVNMVANIVDGKDKIWCMFEDKERKGEVLVYEMNGNGDFSFLMKKAAGAWSMLGDGSACSIPQAVSHFKDPEECKQPIVELFTHGKSTGTTWHLEISEVNTELGVSLGNSTITYIDSKGDLCMVTFDPNSPFKHKSISLINLSDPLPGRPVQPRYVTATRTEIGYDKK